MSILLVDWLNLEQYKKSESGELTFKFLGDLVHLRSAYLALKVTEQAVNLVLYAGPDRREYVYCLSDVHLPSKSGKVALTQSPFVVAVINSLDESLLRTPPTKRFSYKAFTDRFVNYILICEYFALQGRHGLSGVTPNDVKKFFTEISKGWFSTLKVQQRFDELINRDVLTWFINKSPKKNKNRLTFNLVLFKEKVATSLFRKTLNDIPPSIVDHLSVPNNVRTPYEYSGMGDKICTNNDIKFIYGRMSELFASQALPFEKIGDFKPKITIHSSRTTTPTVEDVTRFTEFLFSSFKLGNTLSQNFKEVNELLNNSVSGSRRDRQLKEKITGWKPVVINGDIYKITSLRQIRGNRKENCISLGEAYKIYLSSVAYSTLLFTGWRLNEVVDKKLGLTASNVNYSPKDKLTLINRNIEKSDTDVYERQLTAVGPHIGNLLTALHANNMKFAKSYDDSSPLFSIDLEGTGGGSTLFADLSSTNRDANPLRDIISRHIKVPTPRQLRRYFAVIYFYQFDNPEIMALTHHYGHSSPEETEVYITDTPSRNATKSIKKSIPIKNVSTSDDSEFRKIFNEARDAKLRDLVSKALNGNSTAGFSKIVRAIYRKMREDVEFSELSEESQSEVISEVFLQVKSEGHSVEVYPHGNCTNSEAHADSNTAKCANEFGEMEREYASASVCSGCLFHEVETQHITNLKVSLASLQNMSENIDDIFSCTKTPLERLQDKKQIEELTAIIELYEDEKYTSQF